VKCGALTRKHLLFELLKVQLRLRLRYFLVARERRTLAAVCEGRRHCDLLLRVDTRWEHLQHLDRVFGYFHRRFARALVVRLNFLLGSLNSRLLALLHSQELLIFGFEIYPLHCVFNFLNVR